MIHSTCNMGARDSPDMYALSPRACGPRASGIHIRQIPRAHVTTITCMVSIMIITVLYRPNGFITMAVYIEACVLEPLQWLMRFKGFKFL